MDSSGLNWQPIEKYEEKLASFKLQYGMLPGIISIEDDKWDGSTIVVAADLSKLSKDLLPQKYEGFDVLIIDVYHERDSFQELIDNLKVQYADLPMDSEPIQFFTRRIKVLNDLIEQYEKNQ